VGFKYTTAATVVIITPVMTGEPIVVTGVVGIIIAATVAGIAAGTTVVTVVDTVVVAVGSKI
jgi:hypothetical protein